jgi:hypothetical protein
MALDKDFELTAHAGEIHEVDEIAAQEAVEDARTKAEQGEAGGGLDVCFLRANMQLFISHPVF